MAQGSAEMVQGKENQHAGALPAGEWRRRELRLQMRKHNMNPAKLAKAAGMPSPNAIYNFLGGRTQSLAMSTLQQIKGAIPGFRVDHLLSMVDQDDVVNSCSEEDLWRKEARKRAISNIETSFESVKKRLQELQSAALHCSSQIALIEARLADLKSLDANLEEGNSAIVTKVETNGNEFNIE